MANIKIREELGERVYEIVLALANPTTGIAQVKAGEVLAMIGCGKYDTRHITKALQYLCADNKLNFVSDNGVNGNTYRVPALCKGNTVSKTIEPVTKQAPPRPERLEQLFEKATPVEVTKPVEAVAPQPKPKALANAETVLKDTEHIYEDILRGFIDTRQALSALVREVKRNGA